MTLQNFVVLLLTNDVFFLLGGETWLTRRLRRLEFLIYRIFRRRVVLSFVGADIRSTAYLARKEKALQNEPARRGEPRRLDCGPVTEPWQRRLLRDAAHFGDAVLVSTPDLLELLPDADYLPVTLDVDQIYQRLQEVPVATRRSNEVVLFHAGHQWHTKGTASILRAMKDVQEEFNGRARIVVPGITPRYTGYAVTREEMFTLMRAADIVVDQVLVGWYGMLSIEALLAGKVAVCYLDERFASHLPDGCPIVSAELGSLRQRLSDLVRWRLSGGEVDAASQVEWVRANHSLGAHGQTILRALGLSEQAA
jgi:hypothetical protein